MDKIQVIIGDINNSEHAAHMLELLDDYMQDPMGGEQKMTPELAGMLIEGLKQQPNYVFFIAYCDGEPAGLANCFNNYSTFKAKQILNIHDFAVSPHFRRRGVGDALMEEIIRYCKEKAYGKITLEVRYDNQGAQNLYKKAGFTECDVPMHFWQLMINGLSFSESIKS